MKFITTYQVGRKCRNKLAESVRAGLELDLNDVIKNGLFKDADYWRERIRTVCQDCQEAYPKCKPIYISEHKSPYDKGDGSCSFSLYHSSGDRSDEGSFLSIFVTSEAKYYTPQFNSYQTLNKACKHLFEFARNNYPDWRRGENTYMSPFFISPQTAKDALSHEYARNAVNERTVMHIKLGDYKIDVISVTPTKTLTAFSITFKQLWSK